MTKKTYEVRLSERGVLTSTKVLGFHENVVLAQYYYQQTLGM